MLALLGTSERVCKDLEVSVYGGLDVSVCLRAWQPTLWQEFEFRGFVRGGTLNALSQYDPHVYLPEVVACLVCRPLLSVTVRYCPLLIWQVVACRDSLLAKLTAFWRDRVRPALRDAGPREFARTYDAYAVDLAVLSSGEVAS